MVVTVGMGFSVAWILQLVVVYTAENSCFQRQRLLAEAWELITPKHSNVSLDTAGESHRKSVNQVALMRVWR